MRCKLNTKLKLPITVTMFEAVLFLLVNMGSVFANQQSVYSKVNPEKEPQKASASDMVQVYASIYRLEQFFMIEKCKC